MPEVEEDQDVGDGKDVGSEGTLIGRVGFGRIRRRLEGTLDPDVVDERYGDQKGR